jgi:hypothetical protein
MRSSLPAGSGIVRSSDTTIIKKNLLGSRSKRRSAAFLLPVTAFFVYYNKIGYEIMYNKR